MRSKKYQKKSQRSKRQLQKLPEEAVKVDIVNGQATFQMVLPMNALPAYRWGKEEGHVVFLGHKVAIEKLRVHRTEGGEIPLRYYEAFRNPQRLGQAVEAKLLRRVSSRDYEGVLEDVCEGYGIAKSSVSRHWKAVILLDGKVFADYTLIVALGVDSEGHKHVLGLWPGATENAEVCGALLDDLIDRGLSPQEKYLFIRDGVKALACAVKSRFGKQALIQRCRLHKERNIKKYLLKPSPKVLSLKLRAAWSMADHAEAKLELQKVHDWLATINIAAAQSLDEGFEETLTVNQLNLSPQLRKVFASTNLIESAFSLTDDLCKNVKRWRNANMAWRCAGTVLQEAQKRFHRLHGYRERPLLLSLLEKSVVTNQSIA